MKLFHGSNMEIDKVDLSKCMPSTERFLRGNYYGI